MLPFFKRLVCSFLSTVGLGWCLYGCSVQLCMLDVAHQGALRLKL